MSQPSKEEIAEFLDRCHDELLVRGWTQHQLCDRRTGGVCAIGAMLCAQGGHPNGLLTSRLGVAAWTAIHTTVPSASVSFWNNSPERTFDEVLDMFRHAAKQLREEAGAS